MTWRERGLEGRAEVVGAGLRRGWTDRRTEKRARERAEGGKGGGERAKSGDGEGKQGNSNAEQ
jgi:hypothetical protein